MRSVGFTVAFVVGCDFVAWLRVLLVLGVIGGFVDGFC